MKKKKFKVKNYNDEKEILSGPDGDNGLRDDPQSSEACLLFALEPKTS